MSDCPTGDTVPHGVTRSLTMRVAIAASKTLTTARGIGARRGKLTEGKRRQTHRSDAEEVPGAACIAQMPFRDHGAANPPPMPSPENSNCHPCATVALSRFYFASDAKGGRFFDSFSMTTLFSGLSATLTVSAGSFFSSYSSVAAIFPSLRLRHTVSRQRSSRML